MSEQSEQRDQLVLPTVSLEQLQREVEGGSREQVWRIFLDCPILAVRFKCLAQFRGGENGILSWVWWEQIEEAIRALVLSCQWGGGTREADHQLALELIDLYLFGDSGFTEKAERAVRFVLSLADPTMISFPGWKPLLTPGGLIANAVGGLAKPISARLRQRCDRGHYLALGDLSTRFLTEVLEEAFALSSCERSLEKGIRYQWQYDWSLGLRALRMIHHFRDHRFSLVVERLHFLIKKGHLRPKEAEFFATEQHLVALRALGIELRRAARMETVPAST